MPRKRLPNRLDEILEAATQAFILKGYRAARVDEIAAEVGISSATVYLYAATKEALFALVLRRLFGHDVRALPSPFVFENGLSLVGLAYEYLQRANHTPVLDRLIAGGIDSNAPGFEAVVDELYDLVFRHHRAITLIERCGKDWPELEMLFRNELRAELITKLQGYIALDDRLFGMPDDHTAARAIIEMIAWFAMHRFAADDTSRFEDRVAKETVTTILVRAFTNDNQNEKPASGGIARYRDRRK